MNKPDVWILWLQALITWHRRPWHVLLRSWKSLALWQNLEARRHRQGHPRSMVLEQVKQLDGAMVAAINGPTEADARSRPYDMTNLTESATTFEEAYDTFAPSTEVFATLKVNYDMHVHLCKLLGWKSAPGTSSRIDFGKGNNNVFDFAAWWAKIWCIRDRVTWGKRLLEAGLSHAMIGAEDGTLTVEQDRLG